MELWSVSSIWRLSTVKRDRTAILLRQERHKGVELLGFFCTFSPFLLEKGVRIWPIFACLLFSRRWTSEADGWTKTQRLGYQFIGDRIFSAPWNWLLSQQNHRYLWPLPKLNAKLADYWQRQQLSLRSGDTQEQKHEWNENQSNENIHYQNEKLEQHGENKFSDMIISYILSKRWWVFLLIQIWVKPFLCLRPKGWVSQLSWKYCLYGLCCLPCFHSQKPNLIPRTPCQPSPFLFARYKPGTRGSTATQSTWPSPYHSWFFLFPNTIFRFCIWTYIQFDTLELCKANESGSSVMLGFFCLKLVLN